MGTVHLARDAELGRLVAVKVLAESLAHDPELRERFVREARLAARLSHPNVVAVYDVGEDGGLPYIVMEHVDGETLAEVVARRRLAPAEAVALAVQACAGLEAAHAQGLVHRDVKPRNLLLRRDGTLKVADFGIARAAEAAGLTQTGVVLGTAAYLAPEQAAGEPVTAATDVYALGAVVYELLAGRPPLTLDTLAQLVHKREGRPITPLREVAPGVPDALEDVVMRALARVPRYRPASAAELAAELEAALGEAPTRPLPRPVRRRRRGWPGAALAAAALAALALGLALGTGDDEPPPAAPAGVPAGATPEEDARNLARWLRAHAG